MEFKTYKDAQEWIETRRADLGMTVSRFSSTEEYKAAYPAIQAAYKAENPGPRKRAARVEIPLFGASLLLHANR